MCKEEKKDDFIGKTFPTPKGGVLSVVGKLPKVKGKHIKYLCECSLCSKDKELYPKLFESAKGDLVGSRKKRPQIPCGCAKSPRLNEQQNIVRVLRESQNRGYTFQGWAGSYKGCDTRLKLYNPNTDNSWSTTTMDSFLGGKGDPAKGYIDTASANLIPQGVREFQIKKICEEEDLTFIGWQKEGYKGRFSKFNWYCSEGHLCSNSTVTSFINSGDRCITCRNNLYSGNGYYPDKAEEQDYLYVMDFIKPYKVGRSFDTDRRRKDLKNKELVKGLPEVLQLYTATHQTIYDTEQAIHAELRERGFQYYCDWTNECFTKDCWYILQEILEDYVSSGVLERVS